MSSKIYISVPVNISRSMVNDIKKLCTESEVILPTERHRADDFIMLEQIKAGNVAEIPDILVILRPEILRERDYLVNSGFFDMDYRYDTNSFIRSKNFIDDRWVLKPIYIVPLLIIYNKGVEDPPVSWQSLMDEQFNAKILCTGETTPPAALFKYYLIHYYGDRGKDFVENGVAYRGAPIDVNLAVGKGEYDIGIIPLSFAKFSRGKNTSVCWPREGALALPQVMLLKKGYSEDVKRAADFLISEEKQRNLSQMAGFVPVIPNIPIPAEVTQNDRGLIWEGWDWFIKMTFHRV